MIDQREKILRYYRASGDGEFAAKLLDIADGVIKSRKFKASEFLDPYYLSIAETVAAHYERLSLVNDGGYIGAERVKTAFVSEDFLGTVDFGLGAVALKWDSRYYHLSHRDVLGAILGLGIKREVLGDIIMRGSECQVITDLSMITYIVQNLSQVGQAVVSAEVIPLTDIVPREEKVKEIRATVASLRLDAVAAAGFGTSRTKMSEEISTAKLKVNWQEAKNSAQVVKVGDIISIRGRGRVEICEVPGQTKKGRFSIILRRFM